MLLFVHLRVIDTSLLDANTMENSIPNTEDAIEVENLIEHEDETVPASFLKVGKSFTAPLLREDGDGLFYGLMRRDINSLFGRMASLSRRLCGREMAHALEQGTISIEKLVEKLGNAEDKVECKKLKKELEKARQVNVRNGASGSRPAKGQDAAPATYKCTFAGFMKCNPTAFHGTEGAVELMRWFKKTERVFGISECVEGKKVKFVVATLQGPALTLWNAMVATIGLETVNQMPWTEMKQLMAAEFCPIEERFNELALMCLRMVESERVKVDAYIRELTDNIKGENNQRQGNVRAMVTAPTDGKAYSGSLPLCERCFTRHVGQCTIKCHKCGKIRHKSRYCKEKNVATGANALRIPTCYDFGEQVTGMFLLNSRYVFILFDSGFDRSFVDTRFSSMLDIDLVKIRASYEVELADGRVVSTNTVLKGYTLNLVNHVFEIDLMPIELGTFDVIIGMDWLVKHNVVIIYGKRVVRISYGNKMLIVKSDKGVSRLKVISCIKA
nr:hypothetical protein [Tanacetum cinerariifolium]